jgi:hypothetical protein
MPKRRPKARFLHVKIPENVHQQLEALKDCDDVFRISKTALVLRGIKLAIQELKRKERYRNGEEDD